MAMGDLPMLPKKQRSSIRRATPQVRPSMPFLLHSRVFPLWHDSGL